MSDSKKVIISELTDDDFITERLAITGKMSRCPYERKLFKEDLSRKFERRFIEISPYARDSSTGDFINFSDKPKLVRTNDENVFEKIQSFKDEVDIYKIIKHHEMTGTLDFLSSKYGIYGDVSDIPDNLNDMHNYSNDIISNVSDTDIIDIASKELNEKELKSKIDSLVQRRVNEILKSSSKEGDEK